MNISRNFVLRGLIGMLFLTPLLAVAFLWTVAGQLIHPDRRPLQQYEQDWFDNPSLHGVRIHRYPCQSGRIPCLFVSPDARSGAGERGDLLRSQLENHGYSLTPYGETHGILVLLHGRNGRKEDLLPVAERFAAAGFKCVIPDLPAHGDNPASLTRFSTGRNENDFAASVLSDARSFYQDSTSPAGIWGLSMGGAYAVHAASIGSGTWKAMIVVSSFDSLDGVIQDKLALLPDSIATFADDMLSDMLEYRGGMHLKEVHPAIWAKNINIPVLMVHGDNDSVILPSHGYRLFKMLGSQDKRWLTVHGAGHGNILVTNTPLYEKMSAWFLMHLG